MSQQRALELLRQGVGSPTANFHEHQWESVDAIVNQRCRLICVQRTGWGKSSVYFISTKMMRDQDQGPTIIISPLLALMRNQIESAAKYGVALGTVNSSQTREQNTLNKQQLLSGHLDALIIAPEQLANQEFVDNVIIPSNPGFFVIDEAHCISDWGHDFRPDYRRISRVLGNIADTPVLATTATATGRVVEDVVEQLRVEGQEIYLLRGQLTRESIHLQNIHLDKRSKRLAWLAHNIPHIEGTGIVYATTINDAFLVAAWLRSCGIAAEGYAGSIPGLSKAEGAIKREQLEQQLLNNEIKVLVSTSALGMGFDKGDLAFVFHYQSAGSVVSYYQQVGRAGRSIDDAYGVLLSGDEDQEIQNYFIREAFPKEELVRDLLNLLEEDSCDGLKKADLEAQLNYAPMKIEAALKFLQAEYPTPIVKEGPLYKRTINPYALPTEMIQRLSDRKTGEWQEIQAYLQSGQCLMQVLASALDDTQATPCGKCANCDPGNAFEPTYPQELGQQAVEFLGNTMIDIEPKKQIGNGHAQAENRFPEYDFPYRLGTLEHEPGAALCHWGEAGWGEIAAAGKRAHAFDPKLADACVTMINERWNPDPMPTWVTYIPSQNFPSLVKDFAELVAQKLGLECVEAVVKVNQTAPQKRMENSDFRCKNLDGAFAVQNVREGEPVLLIDDASDSGWTFAVIAALLRREEKWPGIPNGCYVNEIKLKSDKLNTQNNLYSENTQAVLLLSTFFSKPKKGEARPLTAIEYGRFARWLHEFNYTPSSLFHQLDEILSKWKDPKGKITADRLTEILGRKAAMGLALEKWQRAGVWVITRQDSEYPQLLKKQLRHISPPVFFGVGNKSLLQKGGLAVIGSRGIDNIDEEFTQNIAIQAAKESINIVSGAARGVDETAMLASLNAGGTAIGIMADSLLKAATASKWRKHLQNEQLVLISSFYPEAGFSVGNAMARNKYIYTAANAALVVRADEGKGGTWAGAKENNENKWVPLFVKQQSDASGNIVLLNNGAIPLELQSNAEHWLANTLTTAQPVNANNSQPNNLNLFE